DRPRLARAHRFHAVEVVLDGEGARTRGQGEHGDDDRGERSDLPPASPGMAVLKQSMRTHHASGRAVNRTTRGTPLPARSTGPGALAAAAERLAGGLAARGVRAGDVVALQLPNWTETLTVLLAAARLGAVANPVLPIYRRRELGFILAEAGARVLFIPGRYRDCDHRALVRELRPALPALEHVIVVRDQPVDGAHAYAEVAGPAPGPPASDAGTI